MLWGALRSSTYLPRPEVGIALIIAFPNSPQFNIVVKSLDSGPDTNNNDF